MSDPPPPPDQAGSLRAQILRSVTPDLHSSVSNLHSSSRTLPFDRDFHFYYNFDEFRSPIRGIDRNSQLLLSSIGSSAGQLMSRPLGALPEELDDGYDWLVNLNDEALERFDASVDEFKRVRKTEEDSGKRIMDPGDGFQVVSGKKKKNKGAAAAGSDAAGEASSVQVAALRDKKVSGAVRSKVPFHIPTVKKPQDEYNILVNNSNQPFQHVWLQKSEGGERFVHPLEKLSVLDFVDKNAGDIVPQKPLPLEETPYKMVIDVKDLKALATKLRAVNEFAVDLEHNQYRSFQGMTCLMQISTRSEDFVVDTFKLRIHIGPYLREVFKDPAKKKVMHGADRDIVWLQRDFGIYVCNLFDTGQASRVLKLERNSLEFLLHHYCGVAANKEYQNADWRLRPLPEEMLRYAREDTHYLLYIYDLMRLELHKISENSDTALVEVYQRSADICMQLYEKELLMETSYLHIYGLQGADFNAQQLAVVAGLYEWRDVVARAEDESTGYILPNRTLLEIAKHMPVTTGKLRRIIKSKHSFIERNLASAVNIVRHAIQNASAFEAVVEQLKEARVETIVPVEIQPTDEGTLSPEADASPKLATENAVTENTSTSSSMGEDTLELEAGNTTTVISEDPVKGETKTPRNSIVSSSHVKNPPNNGQSRDIDANIRIPSSATANSSATVPVLKKPTRAFGALLGNSGPKRKADMAKKDEGEKKLEQIRSSVNLPFHSFSGKTSNEPIEDRKEEPARTLEAYHAEETSTVQLSTSDAADVIVLEDDSGEEGPAVKSSESAKELDGQVSVSSGMERDEEDEPTSLSELSSSFQKCLDSIGQDGKNSWKVEKSKTIQVKPFDYEAARRQVRFGEDDGKGKPVTDSGKDKSPKVVKGSGGKKSGSSEGQVQGSDGAKEFGPGKRRQAFPASGNRSGTFR
ncbi:protein RRP6-like 2 [Punica granatum]|uniref:Protein RRP6-like 2 n=1 Tax=Punica granatum TaxID=22663 RepID=A0A6P8DLK0_PUNGR|nr:protein RRP6-like 2 [Punica granatum]